MSETIDSATSSIEGAWKTACALHRLPDDPALREAFYHGARSVLTQIVDDVAENRDADEIADTVLRVNEELLAFARAGR